MWIRLLADRDIQLVINLTVPLAHAAVGRRAIDAGKTCLFGEAPSRRPSRMGRRSLKQQRRAVCASVARPTPSWAAAINYAAS